MFETIFEKRPSFVEEYSITKKNGNISLDFTVLPYDLIDDDLDFDEEEYLDKLYDLDQELFEHIKRIVCPTTTVTIFKRRLIFRGNTKLESSMIVSGNNLKEFMVLMDVTERFNGFVS